MIVLMLISAMCKVKAQDAERKAARQCPSGDLPKDLIIYPAKRTPSEEFFEKHTEREVNSEDEEFAAFEYEGRTYACESFFERHV